MVFFFPPCFYFFFLPTALTAAAAVVAALHVKPPLGPRSDLALNGLIQGRLCRMNAGLRHW